MIQDKILVESENKDNDFSFVDTKGSSELQRVEGELIQKQEVAGFLSNDSVSDGKTTELRASEVDGDPGEDSVVDTKDITENGESSQRPAPRLGWGGWTNFDALSSKLKDAAAGAVLNLQQTLKEVSGLDDDDDGVKECDKLSEYPIVPAHRERPPFNKEAIMEKGKNAVQDLKSKFLGGSHGRNSGTAPTVTATESLRQPAAVAAAAPSESHKSGHDSDFEQSSRNLSTRPPEEVVFDECELHHLRPAPVCDDGVEIVSLMDDPVVSVVIAGADVNGKEGLSSSSSSSSVSASFSESRTPPTVGLGGFWGQMAKAIAAGVADVQRSDALRTAAALGTKLAASAERGLETVGRNAIELLHEVTANPGTLSSALPPPSPAATFFSADSMNRFGSFFELYGGDTTCEELAALGSECVGLCNEARLKIQGLPEEAEFERVAGELAVFFSRQPEAVSLALHSLDLGSDLDLKLLDLPFEDEESASEAGAGAGSQTHKPSIAAVDTVTSFLLLCAAFTPPPLYSPVHYLCEDSHSKAETFCVQLASLMPPRAADTSIDSDAIISEIPKASPLDRSFSNASDLSPRGSPKAATPSEEERRLAVEKNVLAVLSSFQTHCAKRMAEICAAQIQLLVDFGTSAAAPARPSRPIGENIDWPAGYRTQGEMLRQVYERMLADIITVAHLYLRTVYAFRTFCVTSPSPVPAGATSGASGASSAGNEGGKTRTTNEADSPAGGERDTRSAQTADSPSPAKGGFSFGINLNAVAEQIGIPQFDSPVLGNLGSRLGLSKKRDDASSSSPSRGPASEARKITTVVERQCDVLRDLVLEGLGLAAERLWVGYRSLIYPLMLRALVQEVLAPRPAAAVIQEDGEASVSMAERVMDKEGLLEKTE